jgi:YVTN family beta-propeller protein
LLSVINGKTANIKIGTGAYDLSVNPLTNIVYVTNSGDDTVSVIDGISASRYISVIDGNTNTVTANIKVGSSPSDVSVNPSTNMVYVIKYHDNTVSVIDGKTNTVTATIKVGTQPSGVSVNTSTNMAGRVLRTQDPTI